MKKALASQSKLVLDHFLNHSLDVLLTENAAISVTEKYLALFHYCANHTPAYKAFLEKQQVDPEQIKNYTDFSALPLTQKNNYIHTYPLVKRCLDGNLLTAERIAVSSGSTGQATFWPRSIANEVDVTLRFEQVFQDSFNAHQRSSLVIICFAMGNWVGGLYTTSCCWHLAYKGYPLSIATPGNNKAEIFRVIKELAPFYEQTVLLGYPPFIKDVLEAGHTEGIDWTQFQLKLVFAGEVFSEEWRSLVCKRMDSSSPAYDTASLYGTADGGVLGNETPLSIAIRRWLADHPSVARKLFGESRLPTLVQYDPVSRFFELYEDTLVVSAENCVPLVRYHIADKGGIIEYQAMMDFLAAQGGIQTFADLGLDNGFKARELPFVFVFGRADFTISFYGANIYPENISVGLEQAGIINWLTGKFVLETQENITGDKFLHIAVELLPEISVPANLAHDIAVSIKNQLLRLNSEFAHYTPEEKQLPLISLFEFGNSAYFPVGVKHRYTRQT